MFKRPMPKPKAQRGISLVEVMVGMTIGLLASLVIFKAFTSSETFRRNVGGAADTVQTAAVVGARLNLMLEEGVYLAPSAFEAGFMSVAHSEEDINNTIDAARKVFAKL